MSNKSSGSSGCALLIGGIVVVGLVIWGIAIALQVLGFLLIIGGPVVGIMLIVSGWRGVGRNRQVERRTAQLQQIAADARQDLTALHSDLDYLALTQGIGADLTEAERGELAALRPEIQSMLVLLDAAVSPENLGEAILRAEQLRLRARRHLP